MIQDIRNILSFFWMKISKKKIEILSKLSVWSVWWYNSTHIIHLFNLLFPGSNSFLFQQPPPKNICSKLVERNACNPFDANVPNPAQTRLVNAACSVKDHPADKEGRSKAWRAARTSRGQAWEASGRMSCGGMTVVMCDEMIVIIEPILIM